MRVGSLFSGIGGLDFGVELAYPGATVSWQVEKDEACRCKLAAAYDETEQFDDVSTVGKHNLAPVDMMCGGFPCQSVSSAGRGAGLADTSKSGLWFEYRRIISEMKPAFVLVENVHSGMARWLPTVLQNLNDLGYNTSAVRVGARDVGAPHRRFRIFVRAWLGAEWPPGARLPKLRWPAGLGAPQHAWEPPRSVADRGNLKLWREALQQLGNAVVPACAAAACGLPAQAAGLVCPDAADLAAVGAHPFGGSGWPMATRQDAVESGSRALSPDMAAHAGLTLTDRVVRGREYHTAGATDHKGSTARQAGKGGGRLTDDVTEAEYPTPSATPYGTGNNGCPHDGREAYATAGKPSLHTLGRQSRGYLNPEWVACLMGLDSRCYSAR